MILLTHTLYGEEERTTKQYNIHILTLQCLIISGHHVSTSNIEGPHYVCWKIDFQLMHISIPVYHQQTTKKDVHHIKYNSKKVSAKKRHIMEEQ